MYQLQDISVFVGDYELKAETDFRVVIDMINDDFDILELLPENYFLLLSEYYDTSDIEQKMEFDRFTIGSQLFLPNEYPPIKDDEDDTPTFSFKKDYVFVISSFQHYYNIDLLNIEFLDFRQFMMLLHNTKQTVLNDIISLRVAKPHKDMTSKQKAELREEQLRYSLTEQSDEPETTDWLEIAKEIEELDLRGD